MDGQTLDVKQNNIAALRGLFPHVFSEDKLDLEKFKAAFGDDINFSNERYTLNWAGKAAAFRILHERTTATLKPQPELSVNFDASENVFIEGENLEVLKILQKSYYNKIKCIIIDPPYNTGSDSFIYPDRFKENLEEYEKRIGEKDEEGYLMKEGLFRKNSKENGHYHSNWLSMMLPRLFLARNLLKDDGVIFVHIDDNEVHNLRMLMNEIFGEENLVATMAINKASEIATGNTIQKHEYIQCYAKDENNFKVLGTSKYSISRGTVGNETQTTPIITFPKGLKCYGIADGTYNETRKIEGSKENIENLDTIVVQNETLMNDVRLKARWRSSNDMRNFFNNGCMPTVAKINGTIEEIYFENDRFNPQIKKATFEKIPSLFLENSRGSKYLEELSLGNMFDNPKDVKLIYQLLKIVTSKDSLILDFFAGSGTTAQAVLELNAEDKGNRNFILVQLPELCGETSEASKAGYKTIADISRERIRRVIQKTGNGAGFKSFKLSPSNFKAWRGEEVVEETVEQQIEAFADPVKTESQTGDMLVELMLKSGYQLTDKVEDKGDFFHVSGKLVVVLRKMDKEIAKKIIELRPKPQKVIVLDRLFAGNDKLKTNITLQMKVGGVEFRTV